MAKSKMIFNLQDLELKTNRLTTNKSIAWGAFLFWLVLIFFLSSQPAFVVSQTATIDDLAHIIAHGGEYALLAIFTLNLFKFYFSNYQQITFFFDVFYALSDEYHQSFVPSRQSSWGDILVDVIGISLTILIFNKITKSNEKN